MDVGNVRNVGLSFVSPVGEKNNGQMDVPIVIMKNLRTTQLLITYSRQSPRFDSYQEVIDEMLIKFRVDRDEEVNMTSK